MPPYPPLTELMPHRPPMLLLDELVHAPDTEVECAVTVRAGAPFVEDGAISSLVSLEYFAQAVAALYGYVGQGGTGGVGVLLGARALTLETPRFAVGERLRVRARCTWSDGGIGHFKCALLRGDEPLASAAINVLYSDDPDEVSL